MNFSDKDTASEKTSSSSGVVVRKRKKSSADHNDYDYPQESLFPGISMDGIGGVVGVGGRKLQRMTGTGRLHSAAFAASDTGRPNAAVVAAAAAGPTAIVANDAPSALMMASGKRTSWGSTATKSSSTNSTTSSSSSTLLKPPPPPKKKMAKRSRILTDDGLIVVGRGGGGGGDGAHSYGGYGGTGAAGDGRKSRNGNNQKSHHHHHPASSSAASSYYFYHGHRHTIEEGVGGNLTNSNKKKHKLQAEQQHDDCSSGSVGSGCSCSSSSRSSPSSLSSSSSCESFHDGMEKGTSHKGILDINSAPTCCTFAKCPHQLDHNSSQSLTISFLNAYGKDYCTKLRRIDDKQGGRPDLSLVLSGQWYLTNKDRTHAIEWMSEASVRLSLTDATFHTAVSFADRLVATRRGMKEPDFHENALACLLVAAKMVETSYEIDMGPQCFINASPHSKMGTKQLLDLESNVCHWLDYRLHTITPLCFLDRFVHASNPSMHYSDAMEREEKRKRMKWTPAEIGSRQWLAEPRSTLQSLCLYFLELATHSPELSSQKPDMLAASAVYLARATIGLNAGIDENAPPSSPPDSLFWNETLEHFTDYTAEELEEVVRTMHELHCETNQSSEWTYVYFKFSAKEYMHVSFIPALLKEDLGFL